MNGFDATVGEFCLGIEELLEKDLFGAAAIIEACEDFVQKPPDAVLCHIPDHQD